MAGCRCGAFVVSRAGATPVHDEEAMAALRPRSGEYGAGGLLFELDMMPDMAELGRRSFPHE